MQIIMEFFLIPAIDFNPSNLIKLFIADIFVENLNETTYDAKMTGSKYIETIIEKINGEDPTGSWREFAEEYIFSEADIKNGSFKRMTPGLIDVS